MCPPTIYMKSSILHVQVCAVCDKSDTTCTSITSPRSRQSQAKLCMAVAYQCYDFKHQS